MSFSLGAINRDTVVTAVIIFASIAFSSFYIYVDIEKIKESAEQEVLKSLQTLSLITDWLPK